jgi:phosphoglycerate dehydrogenase-like enzyme
VLAAMLHFARGLDHAVAAQRSATWGAATFEEATSGVRELDGATIGVIGFGGIGREVARRATAFGMRVLALRRRHGDADAGTSEAVVGTGTTAGGSAGKPARRDVEILAGDHGLERVLAESDFVVLCVPSTPATRGMIGAAEIARMKRDAVLVNVGRGDVLNEDALARALAEGHLRGVALDVFATEPLPPTSPLWRLRNVLVTPHVAATSPRFWERETELIIDNIRRYAGGEPLRNTVDIEAGY